MTLRVGLRKPHEPRRASASVADVVNANAISQLVKLLDSANLCGRVTEASGTSYPNPWTAVGKRLAPTPGLLALAAAPFDGDTPRGKETITACQWVLDLISKLLQPYNYTTPGSLHLPANYKMTPMLFKALSSQKSRCADKLQQNPAS